MGCCNRPSYLRNRLLPKSVHSVIGVLGVSNAAPVDFEDLNARDRWILENRIDQEDGAEFTPLLVELLLASILCRSRSHGFLCSVEIKKESRSSGRRDIFHKLCG